MSARHRQLILSLLCWLPAIALYGVITWLSSKPQLPGPESLVAQWVWFKTAHFLVYGSLTLFTWLGWQGSGWRGARAILATWFTLLIAASLDEWHQMYVPGRTPRPLDVFIDISAAYLVLRLVITRLPIARKIQSLNTWIAEFT